MSTERPPNYTVMARRFRPQTFDDVVGQQHVGQSLRNAIRQGRVAHAYLFTGARGVGKTSTARIFAKALNCPHVVDAVPCNQCEVCQAVSAGQDVDVLEIDGASNRSIDDIRSLRANVNVRSMRSPNKVYIIDEVHMLTREAFNALLKTLEEPPANVKFIFCTTEANKVPDTILSRCQRFDFGTIATGSIAERLRQIAASEGMEVDEEAIELVARRAAGSMRDSQSLFDQLLSFGSDRVTSLDVHRLLGTAPDERVIELTQAIIDRRRDDALTLLDRAALEGVQLGVFSDQLLSYLRDLLIVSVKANEVPLLAVSERCRATLAQQAGQWGLQTITAAMQVLAEAKNRMARVNYARPLFELAIVRMTLLQDLDSLTGLLERVSTGTAGVVTNVAPTTRTALPLAAAPAMSDGQKKNYEPPRVAVPPLPSMPKAVAVEVKPVVAMRDMLPEVENEVSTVSRPVVSVTASDGQNGPAYGATSASLAPEIQREESLDTTRLMGPPAVKPRPSANEEPMPEWRGGEDGAGWDSERAGSFASPTPQPPTSPRVEDSSGRGRPDHALSAPGVPLTGLLELLPQLVSNLPDTIASHAKNTERLASSGPNVLDFVFPRRYAFSKQFCERPETLTKISQIASDQVGHKVSCRMILEDSGPVPSQSAARRDPLPERRRPASVDSDLFVQKAVAIFGGSVIEVREVRPVVVASDDDDTDSPAEMADPE